MSVKPVRVIITGDRHWWCIGFAGRVVRAMREKHGPGLVVVHGAARGVDQSFAEACMYLGVKHEPHPADWDRHGKGAGPIRNGEMVRAGASFCLAFHRNLQGSKGTLDCVRQCLAAGIPVWLVESEASSPKRIETV